ncbi:hypothetical protein [Acinetobacter phage vB_AbaM_IME284]|nr:hypothetical protein [Acinetobacter phage vB_AbaM_IME284]
MNLIDKLNGYENSVKVLYGYKNFGWTIQAVEAHFGFEFTIEQLDKALLEYRRQNKIYEVGDKVVYESECKSNKVYEIESLGGDMGDLTLVGGMKPWEFQVRHATDEEIEKGCRV